MLDSINACTGDKASIIFLNSLFVISFGVGSFSYKLLIINSKSAKSCASE